MSSRVRTRHSGRDHSLQARNTHDSLAEAYAVVGEKDLAITHYNKSLELNPDNDNATTELAKLAG
ncbi:tetratricopeptide repeat protein [Candidatus Bipolaricaulota bacterium]|nr:tetratricopeptide repeat protein [Candidatus Bipolaricaulota bacterium]